MCGCGWSSFTNVYVSACVCVAGLASPKGLQLQVEVHPSLFPQGSGLTHELPAQQIFFSFPVLPGSKAPSLPFPVSATCCMRLQTAQVCF